MADTIHIAWEPPVAVIAVDDGKANAIGPGTLAALNAALDDAEARAGAVVLAGREGFFSAGMDTKLLPTLSRNEALETLGAFARLVRRLFVFPKPVVAAVTGHAVGGGAVLMLAADVRIAAEGAFRLGLSETALRLSVAPFIVSLARATLPPATQTAVVLHCRVFSPAEAVAWGLVDAVQPAGAVLDGAKARAAALAALPQPGYAQTKARLRTLPADDAAMGLEVQLAAIVAGYQAGRPRP